MSCHLVSCLAQSIPKRAGMHLTDKLQNLSPQQAKDPLGWDFFASTQAAIRRYPITEDVILDGKLMACFGHLLTKNG